MKSVSLLSRFAICAVLSVTAGLAFDALALALFAAAVCALVLMIAAADYRPQRGYSSSAAVPALRTRREVMPLAA